MSIQEAPGGLTSSHRYSKLGFQFFRFLRFHWCLSTTKYSRSMASTISLNMGRYPLAGEMENHPARPATQMPTSPSSCWP